MNGIFWFRYSEKKIAKWEHQSELFAESRLLWRSHPSWSDFQSIPFFPFGDRHITDKRNLFYCLSMTCRQQITPIGWKWLWRETCKKRASQQNIIMLLLDSYTTDLPTDIYDYYYLFCFQMYVCILYIHYHNTMRDTPRFVFYKKKSEKDYEGQL